MATKATEREEGEAAPEQTSDGPLLDLTDAAVKRMIKLAKKRGYVTYDELNEVLPSEEFSSEQIEDVLGQLSEMGINVVEAEEAEEGQPAGAAAQDASDDDEPDGGDLVEQAPTRAVAVRETTKEPTDRTDDPVRMYLREMGSVELLSREGEIAIAKRIEAGREAMIAGLCESPLTFQAIIIWRDELVEGRVLLRDIIDLEATYADPEGKGTPAEVGRRRGARRRATASTSPSRLSPRGRGHGRRRHGEQRLPVGHGIGAQAPGPRDLRPHRRQLQEAAPPPGGARGAAAPEQAAHPGPGAQIQEAEGGDRRGREVPVAQQQPHRGPRRAALRHQQAPHLL
jgi:RNA polymerase primary sigma factor